MKKRKKIIHLAPFPYRYELMRDFKLPSGEIMLGRIRYFSDGMVIGSKQFLKGAYAKFGGEIIGKKDRNVYRTNISGCPRIEKKDKMNETGEYKIRPYKGFPG